MAIKKFRKFISFGIIVLGLLLFFPAHSLSVEQKPGNITVDFVDVDIHDVLRILSYKSGVNIVAAPEVEGRVRIRLVDVPWKDALDIILGTYNLGYEERGNVIAVDSIDVLTERKKAKLELREVEPLVNEVVNLKFLDAQDAKKTLDPLLSPRGNISIVQMRGQKGWKFETEEKRLGKRKREEVKEKEEAAVRSKTLVISDVASSVEKIKNVIAEIDIRPKQVLIQARIMEVNEDTLKDLGIDWGTGTTGAESSAVTDVAMRSRDGIRKSTVGGQGLSSQTSPFGFNPLATAITGAFPFNTGLSLIFKKLTPPEMEIIIHALEEDSRTNTLSAPRIVTLDSQEATILVGTRFPILESDVSGEVVSTITASLDYYQDIGIQLNVVPQVNADNMINMIVHPSVTSYTDTVDSHTDSGQVLASYPIILTREAETQLLISDGETIILGGLLTDVKTKTKQGIPYISKIPLLGRLFERDTDDITKVDLLIFLTAHVIDYEKEAAEILADRSILLPQEDFPVDNPKKSRKESKEKLAEQ